MERFEPALDNRPKSLDKMDRTMELSARNQLKGTITSVKLGDIMAEVIVDIGGQELVAAITRSSVERLALAAGRPAIAVIKATEVLIAKESAQ